MREYFTELIPFLNEKKTISNARVQWGETVLSARRQGYRYLLVGHVATAGGI